MGVGGESQAPACKETRYPLYRSLGVPHSRSKPSPGLQRDPVPTVQEPGCAPQPVKAKPRPAKRPGTHCTGAWVRPTAGLDGCGKSRPHRNSIYGPSLNRLSYKHSYHFLATEAKENCFNTTDMQPDYINL
jgi:hypothetical protein